MTKEELNQKLEALRGQARWTDYGKEVLAIIEELWAENEDLKTRFKEFIIKFTVNRNSFTTFEEVEKAAQIEMDKLK